jgi:membrane protease subunit (stomatin/prohibitin family)
MGFVEKLRGELVDVVEWMDDSRGTLVWRFPRYHNQLKNGARLVVRPGQSAVFVDQGRVADTFGPGTYELTTANLPLLSTLRGWKHGFESPFKAEVYFVATRQVTDLKWGTPNPVLLRDPELGPLRVRAFGTYTLRALKPEALLAELVGTDGSFQAEEIEVLLRSIIAAEFSELIAATDIAVVDLASRYGSLSESLRRRVLARVDDEYGLDIPQLYVVNVSVPDSVERALDARSSMGLLGDMGRYQQYQLGSAIPTAAANPAGGLAAAGVGLGMGMAYVGGMAGAGTSPPGAPGSGGIAAAPLPLVPPSPEGDPAAWHVAESGRASGPFTLAQLGQALSSGRLTRESMVWSPGMTAWAPVGQVPRLAVLFAPPPPPAA